MSTITDSKDKAPEAATRELPPVGWVAIAVALAGCGLTTIWPTVVTFWALWTNDALKSIGMVIPVVCLLLILARWRELGWQAEGSWWGLAILFSVIGAVWTQQHAVLLLVVSPHWATALPPASLVLLGYGAGIVMLLAGVRLFRAALFPILLLWFANPVPHAFNLLVDLPLQRVSALIARAFAMRLGQPLTPDHLRLMFTPEFGMFIAPGCNGIRGAVTMGFIALIAGYIYRFRWQVNALVVIGSILLGYVFNLLRLCLLILYYLVALHFPRLQGKAENADYVIGAFLFLIATIFLFSVINHLRESKAVKPQTPSPRPKFRIGNHRTSHATYIAMGLLCLLGCASLLRAKATVRQSDPTLVAEQKFPPRLGHYTLSRQWTENLLNGPIVYLWAQYSPDGGGEPVAIGISPLLTSHDPLICHSIRGDHPLWEGPLSLPTPDFGAVGFSGAFYADGVTQSLEASTQCNAATCGESATERTHLGFIYTRPDPKHLFGDSDEQAIPVLIRLETTDINLTPDVARKQLTEELKDFLAGVNLGQLTQPYRR